MTYEHFLYTIILEAMRRSEDPTNAVKQALKALEQNNS